MDFIRKISDFVKALKAANAEINRDRDMAKKKIECMRMFISDMDKLVADIIEINNLLLSNFYLLLDSDISRAWKDAYNICRSGYCVSADGNAFLTYREDTPRDKSHIRKEYISGIYYEVLDVIHTGERDLEICEKHYCDGEYDIVKQQFDKFRKYVKNKTERSRIDFLRIFEKSAVSVFPELANEE